MAKTVMVFGTFDILHPGHLDLFKQAKKFGDQLLVVVARDQTVKAVKGRPPLHSERSRRAAVARLDLVDRAILGDRTDPMKVIRTYQPAVVCLGYDQQAFVDQLYHNFPDLKIVRLKAHQPERFKSSFYKT